MFLKNKTRDNHSMADAYCGLQKSLRCGDVESCIYWAGQIGTPGGICKGYPNALKKRLVQNSLEDACSWDFAKRVMLETGTNDKASFDELLPWVVRLAQLSKTHTAAWLQRAAVNKVYQNPVREAHEHRFRVSGTSEMEFSVCVMKAVRDEDWVALQSSIDGPAQEGELAMKMFKFINNDPLVFHVYNMHQRRCELNGREISIPKYSGVGLFDRQKATLAGIDVDISAALTTRRELPDEWLDKHTSAGKRMGRGYEHFFLSMKMHPRVYKLGDASAATTSAAEATSARGGVEPYEQEAKGLYLDFVLPGMEGKEARARHVLALTATMALSAGREESKQTQKNAATEGASDSLESDACEGGSKKRKAAVTAGEGIKAAYRSMSSSSSSSSDVGANEAESQGSPKPSKAAKIEDVHKVSCTGESSSSAADTIPGVVTAPTAGVLLDTDVMDIPPGRGGLGFKCATIVGTLRQKLEGLEGVEVGDSVYAKLGEPHAHATFSVACSAMRQALHLTWVPTILSWVIPTRDYSALAGLTNPTWAAGVKNRMSKALRQYATNPEAPGALPTIISGVFVGGRLSHAADAVTDGMDLLKILIFRKYVGAADTNASNIMIESASSNGSSPRLFSVDETIASPEQLVQYASKGLITSQSIHSTLLAKVAEALVGRPLEVAAFVDALRAVPLPDIVAHGVVRADTGGTSTSAAGSGSGSASSGRLCKVHSAAPFDAKSMQTLRGGDKTELVKLARSLKIM